MKNTYQIIGLIMVITLFTTGTSTAQCGTVAWLDAITNNANNNMQVTLTDASGNPAQNPLTADTDYHLVIRATGGTCLISDFGCNTGAAPVSFIIQDLALGCTLDGQTIPPSSTGRDVGSSNNYTTSRIFLRTLPVGQFFGQVILLIRAQGVEVGQCGLNTSGLAYSWNSQTDL